MIYYLNNIKFGHPKLYKYQFEYFEKIFIPRLHLDFKKINKIIITGDIFYNTKHTTFSLISKVKKILEEISIPIEIIDNEYCSEIFNLKKIKEIEVDTSVSLFQFNKNDKSEIGFFIDDKFIRNDSTPKFIEYSINNINDIEKIEIKNDFIDIIINSDLLDNQQNKNKIDIFLNNNNFNNVFYTENIKQDDKVKMDSKNIKIREILMNNIEEDLKGELTEIFTIHDEKTKI